MTTGVIAAGDGVLQTESWTAPQIKVLVLCAIAVMFDGFDNLVLGFSIPSLMADWHLERGDFIPVVATSLICMSIGTAALGWAGDRFGRKPMLIASVALFGIATLAGSAAPDVTTFAILRGIAALGLGGAIPNTTALLAEFTPAGRQSSAITMVILCVPLGGLIGGGAAAAILPLAGWRTLFLVGGAAPLMFALVLLMALPESPQFLARQSDRQKQDASLTAGIDLSPLRPAKSVRFGSLFSRDLRRDTIALCVMLFCNSLAVYTVFNWGPSLVVSRGYSMAQASLALSAFNFGGILGALVGGRLMDRLGSRPALVTYTISGALLGPLLVAFGWPTGVMPLYIGFFALGICCCGVQSMMFALPSIVYSEEIRASGTGTVIGIGRLGAIGSAIAGAGMLAVDLRDVLLILSIMLAFATIALFCVRRHSKRL